MNLTNRRNVCRWLAASALASTSLPLLGCGRFDGVEPQVIEPSDDREPVDWTEATSPAGLLDSMGSGLVDGGAIRGKKVVILLSSAQDADRPTVELLALGLCGLVASRGSRSLTVFREEAPPSAVDRADIVPFAGVADRTVVDLATNSCGLGTVAVSSALSEADLLVNFSLGLPAIPTLLRVVDASIRAEAARAGREADLLGDLASTFTPTHSMIYFRGGDDPTRGRPTLLAGRSPAAVDSAYRRRGALPDPTPSAWLDDLPSWLGCIAPANIILRRREIPA